jgi:hypothetical protein
MANSRNRCTRCKENKPLQDGFRTPLGFFCSHTCQYDYVIDSNNKSRIKAVEKKITNARDKKDKELIKPKSKLLSEAQAAFNKDIRERDYYEPCISCLKSRQEIEAAHGTKLGGAWDAGHFKGRGAKGQLRFVLFNVHKQCKPCNAGGGKYSSKEATVNANYTINLIEKIGKEKVEWLENNNELDLKKNDVEYLNRVKKIFTRRARNRKKRRLILQDIAA